MKNIHILPTDKPSRLIKDFNNKLLLNNSDTQFLRDGYQFQNIYITSDEEITNCDCYVINVVGEISRRTVFKPIKVTEDIVRKEPLITYPNGGWCKKIILTTDQDLIKDGVQEIDDEFLEWFVKNPSCEEVEVESKITKDGVWTDLKGYVELPTTHSIIHKIIIPKEELKYPIGGYAPGYYMCNCSTCKKQFQGDKRAVQCEPCAIEMIKEEPKQPKTFKELFVNTNIEPTTDESGNIHYNFKATKKQERLEDNTISKERLGRVFKNAKNHLDKGTMARFRASGFLEGILFAFNELEEGKDFIFKDIEYEEIGWFGKKVIKTRKQTYSEFIIEKFESFLNK